MKFWDSSAIVPLFVGELQTHWAQQMLGSDSNVVVWALSPVEVHSGLARRRREGSLSATDSLVARDRARRFFAAATPVLAVEQVAERAIRVLDLHVLRAADALQMAAAILTARERPGDLEFVTLDSRLAEAADREGFVVRTTSG